MIIINGGGGGGGGGGCELYLTHVICHVHSLLPRA
jgi:hypothetical protein